jgi:hypothetical protein
LHTMEFDHDRGITGALSREAKLVTCRVRSRVRDRSKSQFRGRSCRKRNRLESLAADGGLSRHERDGLAGAVYSPYACPQRRSRRFAITPSRHFCSRPLSRQRIDSRMRLEKSGVTAVAFIGIDWRALLLRADASQSRRSLLLGLQLAHELIGAAIPSEFLSAMRADPTMDRLARQVVSAMFRNFGDRAGLSQELIVPLLSIETAPQRIRYLSDRAIWPTLEDWEAMPLPTSLFPLYFLTRPFRLAFAKAKKLLGR